LLKKQLLITLGLFLFFIQLIEEHKPVESKNDIPVFRWFSLDEVLVNESIGNFVKDSLLRAPFASPYIEVKWAPLHPNVLGLTTEVADGIFFIQLSRGLTLEQTQRVLMHELIHVYQFHHNLLEDLPGHVVRWKGDLYRWSLPWKDRPWEINAEAWSDELFKPDDPNLTD
jgi:hypothetical protein